VWSAADRHPEHSATVYQPHLAKIAICSDIPAVSHNHVVDFHPALPAAALWGADGLVCCIPAAVSSD